MDGSVSGGGLISAIEPLLVSSGSVIFAFELVVMGKRHLALMLFSAGVLSLMGSLALKSLSTTNVFVAERQSASKSPILPSDADRPRMADGRHYPIVPDDPIKLADLLQEVEEALLQPSTPKEDLPSLGHQQQLIYRVLSKDLPTSNQVLAHLPSRWRHVAERHLVARREFLAMHRRSFRPRLMPAWRIIPPEPAEKLLSYYRKAESSTGIDWEVLAAVNLVETGMGRIDGVSVANAQGPMQFLPTTWQENGIGEGDIRDPHDAIQAAARYLVRRGGLQDIRKGLWGYNNSDHYGRAVLEYTALLKEDPRAFTGLYHWEIHFDIDAGDLWLPVGYNQNKPIPVSTYLRKFPASSPR
ncbi:lytic transglycosylase domain-containing protein [Prochlorococcus marinus]|uniref:lytic transglycosylase domain-containing protein n=1 Tax=Prochlorococcus TaxID=1218 RepID=UPI0007B32DDC|nr:lytic transglycosylase domain-containing protein [Prochlorococcus marinus]KZR75635.1 Transglycosylase SLT domain protein [Prochlorococcus marinus str. MIT 1323]